MKKGVFFAFMLSMTIFTAIYGNNILEKDLLMQLANQDDTSIEHVENDRYYVNAERVYLESDGLYLNSDCFGPLLIRTLLQDNQGIYTVGAFYIYRCNSCKRHYNSPPPKCRSCGGTAFSIVDLSPN